MRSKFYLVFLLIQIFGYSCLGQISLEDCHELARENYPLIKQYELLESSEEYTLSNANKAYLPQLDLTLIGGVISGLPSFSGPGNETTSSSDWQMISVVGINQVIWDGGITKAKKGLIEANTEIEKADLEVSLFALEKRVNNLFFGVLLIDEQIEQMNVLRSTLDRNLNRVEIAVENGTAYRSDVDEVRVELIRTDQKVEELKSNRKAYLKVLEAMIGRSIDPASKLIRPEVDQQFLMRENNRPELELFENRENSIEAQSAIDRSMLYPKFGLLGFGTFIQPGVDFGASTLDHIFVGGLSLSWSLEGLYRNGNNKKLKELNLQQVALQRETFLFNNELDLTQTRVELEKYENLIAQDREIVELKEGIRKAYQVKYDNGISTMSEYLDSTNEESIAIQNLITHEIRYLMKAYEYMNKTGN